MPKEDATLGDAAAKNGKITSHRFLGGHTWLAAMRHDPAQLEREGALLRSAATIDIAGMQVGSEARLLPDSRPRAAGEHVVIDVVIRNVGAGHRFPGGTLDAQDTWVELRAFDGRGKLVSGAGTGHEKGKDPTFAADTHVLRAVILDDTGQPVLARETEKFRAVVVDRTIAPRDAAVVTYDLRIPEGVRWPLRLEAKLRHRSRSLTVQASACEHTKQPASRAFDAGFIASYAFATPLDPCAPEPVLDLATSTVGLGPGASSRDASQDFTRAYGWGQGMLHVLQERLDRGACSASLGRRVGTDARWSTPWRSACSVSSLRRKGRVDEAFERLGAAQTLIGPHPFFDRTRGEVLASVWREQEATRYFLDAAAAALRDDAVQSELTVNLGSAGLPGVRSPGEPAHAPPPTP